MKTWVAELAIAALVLAAVALAQPSWVALLSAAAVLGSFAHMQVGERLRERQATKKLADVDCYRLLNLYLVLKEGLWVAFFIITNAWPALAGCALFLLYPVWRKIWRKHHPLKVAAHSNHAGGRW